MQTFLTFFAFRSFNIAFRYLFQTSVVSKPELEEVMSSASINQLEDITLCKQVTIGSSCAIKCKRASKEQENCKIGTHTFMILDVWFKSSTMQFLMILDLVDSWEQCPPPPQRIDCLYADECWQPIVLHFLSITIMSHALYKLVPLQWWVNALYKLVTLISDANLGFSSIFLMASFHQVLYIAIASLPYFTTT